jgi:hypothetical protein
MPVKKSRLKEGGNELPLLRLEKKNMMPVQSTIKGRG